VHPCQQQSALCKRLEGNGEEAHMRWDVPRCGNVVYDWHWTVYSAPLHFPKTKLNQWFMLNAPSEAVAFVKKNIWVSCYNFLAEQKVSVGHVHPSWMTAAVLRIKSSGLSEVTMSIYSALH